MIEYQEHSLTEVLDFFAKAFQTTDGSTIVNYEACVTLDKRVIFKLYLDAPDLTNPRLKREP